MDELDDDGGHVVAAETLAGGKVSGTAVIHEFLDALGEFTHASLLTAKVAVVDGLVAESDSLLGGHDIPDSVASQEDEFGVVGDREHLDIGVGSDDLVLNLEQGVVFIFKVTEGARKSEHTVDAAVFDEAIGVVDALSLLGVVGLVILRHIDGLLVLGQNSTGVSSVSAVDLSGGHEHDSGGAASETLSVVTHIVVAGGLGDLVELFLTMFRRHQLVHLNKGFFEGLLVALALVTLQFN